jgi:glutathione S-transferase
LGKSPVIEDNGLILAESGAILEYLQETYDAESRLKPLDPAHKVQYRFWLHYAEGSLMPLLLMKLVFSSLGKPPVPFGIRTLGKALGQGCRKRTLTASWKPMRALLSRTLLKTAGLPGIRSAWPTFK